MSSESLRRALGHRKLHAPQLRVVLLDSGYHVQQECADALATLGHHVARVPIVPTQPSAAPVVDRLLRTLIRVRPDFVLSINQIGFDDAGVLGALLDDIAMPVAVWYVDSPIFILRRSDLPAPAMSTVYTWERAYIPILRDLGATDVHYLPLGCAPERWRSAPATPCWPISFVGDSMQRTTGDARRRLSRVQLHQAEILAAQLAVDRSVLLRFWRALSSDALACATFAATGTYRHTLLQRLTPEDGLHLAGDPGWQRLLPQAQYHAPIPYGTALAAVYATSVINVNATSLQMPTAVNQRVFDVPAAGGFLLTDAQADTAEHFAPNAEVATYANAADLQDKAVYYGRHTRAADAIVTAARRRIAATHTYRHRVASMLRTLRARHASRQSELH